MISEEQRAQVIAALRDQAGAGTLDLDEYGVRLSEAYAATTADELQQALRNLPVAAVADPPPPPRPQAQAQSTARPVPVSMSRPGPHQHQHRPHQPMSPAKVEAAARAAWGAHLGTYIAVNLMLVAIWAMTGMGYFWPIWPIMGWGIGLAAHGMAHSATMRARHRRELGKG